MLHNTATKQEVSLLEIHEARLWKVPYPRCGISKLPLAITDGGLLMFLGLEKLRGKPLSIKTQGIIQNVAAAFFISFFVFITILDFGKLSLFLK